MKKEFLMLLEHQHDDECGCGRDHDQDGGGSHVQLRMLGHTEITSMSIMTKITHVQVRMRS